MTRMSRLPRPITLFTGQWTDLPFEEVAGLAADWGYDGLEIACWGDHLDVSRWDDDEYVAGRLEILRRHGLHVWAISNHLAGQAVCDDPIDERHRAILPRRVWGDGEPEGVRRRAAGELTDTARMAARLGVRTVAGFTGSSIWKSVAMFPPVPAGMVEAGYQDFADRWHPILDVFEEHGDFVSVGLGDVPWGRCFRALAAIGYDGPISVEPSGQAFDAVFSAGGQ